MLTAERSATPMPDSRVGLYYDPLFLGHDTVGHIESIERVAAPLRLLEESGVAGRMVRRACRDATEEEIERIHDPRLMHVRSPCRRGPGDTARRATWK